MQQKSPLTACPVLVRQHVHDLAQAAGTAGHPGIRKAWTDVGYKNAVVEHGATPGIDVEVVRREPATRGLAVQTRRWSEAMVHVAMISLMAR